MIPLGQGVKHAVGAKKKIVLLVDPAQRVIGIIAMTTSTVVLTLLKEQTPYTKYSQAVLTKSRLLTVMNGADKLSFGVDRICAVLAPFDMVTSIPTIIPLLTADVRANINTIRTANDFIQGVKTRIRPSPSSSPDNLQNAAAPTSLFGRVTGWRKGTISWVANAVKRPISATIESREKQLLATASGHITDGVLKGGLGFLTSQALKVYLASFTGFGIELVFRGVIGVTSYTPEEVEAMAAWTRFCVQWTIYIALVNQSLKQWRDKRAEALIAVEHPVAALMNGVDLSSLRNRMRKDEEIIPTFEQFQERGEAAFIRPEAEEVDQEPPEEPAVLEIVATGVGTHTLSTLVNQGALSDATNTQFVVGALAQRVMPVLDFNNPRGERGRQILAGVGTYLSELVRRKPATTEDEQEQPPEVESTLSR